MRAVIQRVNFAKVSVDGKVIGEIDKGFMVLLGVTAQDTQAHCDVLVKKTSQMRIFEDEQEKMNLTLADVGGSVLVVSQFTLYADCKKGNRPSFIEAARPEVAIPLYESYIEGLKKCEGIVKVEHGEFGADMKVSLENDGPVTIILDTDNLKVKLQ